MTDIGHNGQVQKHGCIQRKYALAIYLTVTRFTEAVTSIIFKGGYHEIEKENVEWGDEWKILVDDKDLPPPIATQQQPEKQVDIQEVHSSKFEEEDKDEEEK